MFALAAGTLYGRQASDTLLYLCAFAQAGLSLDIARRLAQGPGDALLLGAVCAAALALRLWFLFEPPWLSGDIYRYIWDGRVIDAGFNPYTHIPADPQLAFLRDPAQYNLIDKRDYAVTIYPPVAEAIFALTTRLSSAVVAMKLTMLVFEGVAVLAALRIMGRLDVPAAWIAAYLLHPAPIWEIADNGHVEPAVMAFVFGALAFGLTAKSSRPAAALLTLGALVKPTAALALPAVWKPKDWATPLMCVALAALAYLPFATAGAGVFGFLPNYAHEQGLVSGKGFFLVALLQAAGVNAPWLTPAYLGLAGSIVAGLALWIGFDADTGLRNVLRGTAIPMIVFLALLSPSLPWYFLPAALFSPLLGLWTPWAMMTGGFLLYSFNADAVAFLPRWSISMAMILPALIVDIRRFLEKPSAS